VKWKRQGEKAKKREGERKWDGGGRSREVGRN